MPAICDEYEVQVEPDYRYRCSIKDYLTDDSRVGEKSRYYTQKGPSESYKVKRAPKKEIDVNSVIFLSSHLSRRLGATEISKAILKDNFDALATKWQEETSFHSAPVIKFRHPAYKAIITMGKDILPLIIEQLEQGSKIWSHALKEISGVNPAMNADNPAAANKAWLAWWKRTEVK